MDQRDLDFRQLLAEDWGRRLFYWLVHEHCGLLNVSFAGGIKDGQAAAQHTALNEGRREVAAELVQMASDMSPGDYLTCMAEAIESRRKDRAFTAEEKSNESKSV